jgi:RNase P subunit RPR2
MLIGLKILRGFDSIRDYYYETQETSALFQCHIDQMFSSNKLSFKVLNLYDDPEAIQHVNIEKFRPLFTRIINQHLTARIAEGYEYQNIRQKELRILYIELVDNVDISRAISGKYGLYPKSAICQNCHRYYIIDKGRPCKCSSPVNQFTFIAFCDECGAAYPIEAMSNVGKDCSKCGEKNGMQIITWNKKDDLRSYKVKCIKCSVIASLYLLHCDHIDHQTKKMRSNKPKSRFRGVPTRAGAIYHPLILSIPDIPQIDEIDINGSRNNNGKLLSEAFVEFFSDIDGVNESHLYLPEFRSCLITKDNFWDSPLINIICTEFSLDRHKKNEWEDFSFWKVIKKLLQMVKLLLNPCENGQSNKIEIIEKYGLTEIGNCLKTTADIEFDEQELQGLFLLSGEQNQKISTGDYATLSRIQPQCTPPNWSKMLQLFGLEKIVHISNLNMIQPISDSI